MNPYLLALVISMSLNMFFFILANAFKTDKFTDFTYGLTFIVLALLFLFQNQSFYSHQLILVAMIVLWALRLMSYLLTRIIKIGRDKRFDEMRKSSLQFFKFWFFQGLAVWVIMLPSVYLLTTSKEMTVNPVMTIGTVVWVLGLIIETISDWQKFVFKNNPKNKGMWIESGLWRYSRHPNYFGEMLVWWGVFVFAIPFLSGLSWITILGPVFITFILLFVSGIPLLEKKYDQRYAKNHEYQEYKKNTNLLIPFLVKK